MEYRLHLSLVLLAVVCACVDAQGSQDTIDRGGSCRTYGNKVTKPFHIVPDVKLWQCIILLLCFGAFTIFIVLIHKLIRTFVYYDAHLLDTFFDGGGDVNLGLIACAVVAKWTYTSTFTVSTTDVIRHGLVGSFWYATATIVPICLFAIVAAEIRIKAPGAKTFLQVIKVRHGTLAHVTLIIVAILVNMLVVGMVMMEGTRILASVTDDLNKEVILLLLCVVVCIYTVVGGVGGSIYVAYFSCVIMFCIAVVFLMDVFWDPLGREDNLYGNLTVVYDRLQCIIIEESAGNEGRSPITFISRGGLEEGLVLLFSGFSMVFVDQSFWQIGVASKPQHGVWGFLTGALAYFALPLAISYALGLAYWILLVDYTPSVYNHEIADQGFLNGTVFVVAAQQLMGTTGTFLVFVMITLAVITTSSGQVLSASSIIIYDMYQTYISPFKETTLLDRGVSPRAAKAIRNEEYLEYDRRCVVLKHVVVVACSMLPLAIALVLLAINIDHWWLFNITGLIANSCVLPIGLAITWHRIQGLGIVIGVVSGLVSGWLTWLIFAGVQYSGLSPFREATGGTGVSLTPGPFVAGLAVALIVGGLVCIVVSLTCGGCDGTLQEEEVWEKTRQIDNPILPWQIKYAPEVGTHNVTSGRPHFYTMRRTFKLSEICAYILGVLLAVIILLVWPALMLTQQIFTESAFRSWTYLVLLWLIFGLLFLTFVPLVWEIFSICRQAYYNGVWVKSEEQTRLDLDTGGQDPGSNFSSTEESGQRRSAYEAGERWRAQVELQ